MSHAPRDYRCPFCALVNGTGCEGMLSHAHDIVCRNDLAIAFIASHGPPKNRGHVLVVPTAHYENLYELPDNVGAAVFAMSKRIAVAIKAAYRCDGVSTRQHNEPAGDQDVWHYHLHVLPRYVGDDLYYQRTELRLAPPSERAAYAAKLCDALAASGDPHSGR